MKRKSYHADRELAKSLQPAKSRKSNDLSEEVSDELNTSGKLKKLGTSNVARLDSLKWQD